MNSLGHRRFLPALAAGLCTAALAGCSVEPTGRSLGSPRPPVVTPAPTADAAEEDVPAADLPGTPRYAAGDGVDLGIVPRSRSRAARLLEGALGTMVREHTGYFHVTGPDGTSEGFRNGKWDLRADRASFEVPVPQGTYVFQFSAADVWAGLSPATNSAPIPACWIHAPLTEAFTPLAEVLVALAAEPEGISRTDPDTVVARVPLAAAIMAVLPSAYNGEEPRPSDLTRTVRVLATFEQGMIDSVIIPIRDTIDAFGVKRLPDPVRQALEPSMGELTVEYTDIGARVVIEPPTPPTEVLEADSLEDLTYADADCERMRPATG